MITFQFIFRKIFSRKIALSALALLAATALLYPLLKDNVNRRQAVAETASKSSAPLSQADKEAQAREAYGRLPMSFEANQGQTDGRVKFLARGQGYGLFLTADEAVLSLRKAQAKENARSSSGVSVLKMKLAGADSQARATGVDELPGKSNYFIGNDPQQWRASVPNFARVKYEGVYSGVDLIYYGNQRTLEYDFVVAPGADASQIKLSFDGASRMRIDSKGELALTLDGGEVRQHKPFIYQEVGGEKREIAGRYVQKGEREIGFELGAYDETKPLVIDPVLVYSTYLGGSSTDDGYGIAVDAQGNAYVTGMTNSLNFPVTPGALKTSLQPLSNTSIYYSDAFVTKLNPAGTALVYSTYLGGSAAGEIARGIAVDAQGNAYITGSTGGGAVTTTTNDFPVVNAYQSAFGGTDDAFVTKLNPTGNALIFSTYLGGNDSDSGQRILVNPTSGESYVVGSAISTNFPTTPGAFKSAPCPTTPCTSYTSDAFVTKFSAAGGVAQFSTLLGGDGAEVAYDLALDASANIYITGTTTSNNFPVTAGAFQMVNGGSDAFVAKMNPQGSGLVYATYLGGGPQSDRGFAIDVDAAGNAYVAGQTQSAGFPTTAGAYDISYNGGEDAFLTKFNESGTALLFSTFFGGAAEDLVRAIVVNGNGEAFIAGQTKSADFPTRNSLQARQGTDIFLTRFNATGSAFIFSTLLGNGGARDVALDTGGNAYLTGEAISIPVTPGAFQTTRGNATTIHDGFVMKLAPADESIQGYSISGIITDLNNYDPPTYTIPITVTLSGTVSRAVTVTLTNPSYSFGNLPAGGTYTITATRQGFVIDPPSETFPNLGANQTANFSILVNQKPEGTITSPASGTSVNAPGPVNITADASDADGTISKVEFYAYSNELGTVFIGSDTSAPYAVSWTNVLAGDYTLSAIPVDNLGLGGFSTNYVQLHVASSTAPTVALTSPVDGASYPAGAYVPVTASVTANGSGAISLVEFYSGSELIGRRYDAPYSINWWAQTSGSFALTTKAYDTGGGVATSAIVNVIITTASPSISGRVLERFLPVAGVTVTLSGAQNATVTTGADGRYSFDHLTPNNSYHITASKDGYTLYPAARDIDLYLYDVAIDFTATRITPVTAQVTSPAPYQQFDPPANITLEASAESTAGAITKVEFYVTGTGGETLLGADTTAPYSFAWSNVASGSYWIHVVATDATGETGYSEDVQITVRGAVTPLRINGQVRDGNGNGIQGLTVTLGGSQTGSFVTIAGGYYVFNNLQPDGNYTVTAPSNYTFTPPSHIFNNLTADVLDADFVTASINQAPTVAITSPTNGAVYTMPADIPVSANATDADGSIVKVYFNSGAGIIAEDTVPPYSFVWQVRAPGTYTLTATAIDNSGLRTTSSPVVITVNPPAPTTITGRIVDRNSIGIPDVSMTLESGSPGDMTPIATTMTDASGNYSFANLTTFANYAVSASKLNYTFAPVRRVFFNLSTAQVADFTATLVLQPSDFDGDGKTDAAVWRPSSGTWYISRTSDGVTQTEQFGSQSYGDIPVPGNYDGDGKTDLAVFRPSNSTWYIMLSSNHQLRYQQWGASTDKPAPGDYDGDGKTDLAVFRPSNNGWYIQRSSDNGVQAQGFGASGDVPVAGDYDGDGKTDIAVWRPSTGAWYVQQTSDGTVKGLPWGANGDMAVSGDYDGDKKMDFAVFRPSNGYWYIYRSSDGGVSVQQWGMSGDKPVPGDYDLDGKTDIAVFRSSNGYWYVQQSSNGVLLAQPWGARGDTPVPSTYIP